MNPPKTSSTSSAPAASSGGITAPRVSLPLAGLVLALGAVLLAGGAGFGLALLLAPSAAAPSAAAWAAALGAALGVAAAAVPLSGLMTRLLGDAEPSAARAGLQVGSAPSASMPRSLFLELAQREWARARRYGTGAALLLVDVDRYARLCEARGAAAGEAVLNELLQQTAPTLRTADVLTRFSQTQMAVFLAHADATGALDVAERIRERSEQLEAAVQPPGAQRLRFTVSIGVAHLRAAHLNLQALIDDAEEAVMAARQAAGNCVRAAPLESGRTRPLGGWREDRRARPNPRANPRPEAGGGPG